MFQVINSKTKRVQSLEPFKERSQAVIFMYGLEAEDFEYYCNPQSYEIIEVLNSESE